MRAAVKYLVEELLADVNAFDHEGNTALHHAAARGDVEMIEYLVSKGADVKAVSREGRTTADMANGPVQRTQPFPEALALLEKLGAKNNHRCRLLVYHFDGSGLTDGPVGRNFVLICLDRTPDRP
jgi:ankyrin repeat protein